MFLYTACRLNTNQEMVTVTSDYTGSAHSVSLFIIKGIGFRPLGIP